MHFTTTVLLALASSVSLSAAGTVKGKRQYGSTTSTTSGGSSSGGSSWGGSSSESMSGMSGMSGKVHHVAVGNANGDAVFNPGTIRAAKGDMVSFSFWPMNHSIVQAALDKPCEPLDDNAFYSGFVPVDKGVSPKVWNIMVDSTEPIWFYCAQEGHCQAGMVGVINPTADATWQDFAANAKKWKATSTWPKEPQGGTWTSAKSSSWGGSSSGGGSNSTGGSSPPEGAAGHVVASTSMVGTLAGLIAWALL